MNDREIKELEEQNLVLYSMLYEILEKQGIENVASTIEQMTNLQLEKQCDWYKNNRLCEHLQQEQIAEMKEHREAMLVADKRIKELEAESERLQQIVDNLRDKEFAGKALVEAVNAVYEPLYKNKYDEAEELKQQLAEKEKEIEQLKKFDDLNKTFFDLFRTAFKEPNKVDDLFNIFKTMQEKQDQDKISFAVEQLEKVLVLIHNAVNIDSSEYDLVGLYDAVSNQIKELKEVR